MSRELQLVKNTMVLSIGSFLPKLVSLITLPIITGCLTKAEVGNYDLLLTLVALMVPVATLQTHSGAFRFLIENRKNKVESGKIISSILAFCLPMLVLISVSVGLLWPGFEMKIRIWLIAFFFLDGLTVINGQIVRGLGYNKFYAASSIIISIINCICIVVAVYNAKLGLFGVVLSYIISHIIALSYMLFRVRIHDYISLRFVSRSTIKDLVSYSWPMIPNNLSNWVLNLSDRLVIIWFLGIEANAVYSVANKIPKIIMTGQGIVSMAWQENASLAVNDQDSKAYYSKVFEHMLSMMVGITALLIGFAPLLFKLLIHGDYAEAYTQMPILFLGVFFSCMSSFFGGIYIAHKQTKSVGLTTVAAAAINLFIDFILIKRIGITAGSISTLIAYLALFLFRSIDVKRFQPIDYNITKQFIYYATLCLMLVLCFVNKRELNIINGVIGIIAFIVMNQKTILLGVKRVKKKLHK